VSGQQYPIDHPTNLPDERGTSYPTIVARLEHKLAILEIEGASPDGLIPPISILYFQYFSELSVDLMHDMNILCHISDSRCRYSSKFHDIN